MKIRYVIHLFYQNAQAAMLGDRLQCEQKEIAELVSLENTKIMKSKQTCNGALTLLLAHRRLDGHRYM